MSVLSTKPRSDNPVTTDVLDAVCKDLRVRIKDEEKEEYKLLLGAFHESAAELMAMDDYVPLTDVGQYPREDIRLAEVSGNSHGAWAWRCSVKDTKPNSGLLAGKTIALKDNISVKDVPSLMGTEFIRDFVPILDASVTTRILQAGGHITGVVHSPYAKGCSAGGSSSGSGVLIALGEVDMSIGADQGGSVRIPRTHCGIVGLKPTFGLIPYTGCGSNEATNDHLGHMTKTVLDNALLLQAVAGSDNIDDRSFAAGMPEKLPKYYDGLKAHSNPQDLTGIKIGIIEESLKLSVLDPRVKDCFNTAVENFRRLGATVSSTSIPIHSKGPLVWTGVSKVGGYFTKINGYNGRRGHAMHELSTLFKQALESPAQWDKAYVATKNIYLNGAYAEQTFPSLHAQATNLSRQLRDAYDQALEQFDILLTPTLPYVATSHCSPDASPLEHIKKQVGLVGNTCQFNQTGHPALAMPIGRLSPAEGPLMGREDVKLPVGMQLVGKWWGEEMVFRVGYAWEMANDWREM